MSNTRSTFMTYNKDKVKIQTSNILLQIGIPGNVAGSKYLLRAVEIAINNPIAVMSVTKIFILLLLWNIIQRQAI